MHEESSHHNSPDRVACFTEYHATCYGPAQVSAAERVMAVPPVNPTRAVSRTTHLPLVQVVTERAGGHHSQARVIYYS